MNSKPVNAAVVIPVYNRPQAVLETLASVARQTRPPKAVLVVDDGSIDDTAEAVREWSRRHPRFPLHLIQQRNQGVSAARNRGLQAGAACRYMAFLDSDDLWPRNFLERTVACLDARWDAVAVSADFVRLDFKGWRRKLKRQIHVQREERATQHIFRSNMQVQTCLYRTTAVEQLGGFHEGLATGEDLEFALRLSLLGPWLHSPGQPVIYRLGYSAQQGEQNSLSRKFADNHRRFARIREHFLLEQGGMAFVSPSVYRPVLNSSWRRAARELLNAGLKPEAEECFARALDWNSHTDVVWGRLRIAWDRASAPVARLCAKASSAMYSGF